MKRFKKYGSIKNINNIEIIDKIKRTVPIDEIWCVLEKIHGANIQIWSDGIEVLFGKRNSFLQNDYSFYNFQIVLPKYAESVKKLSLFLKKPITIYGELFGGKFKGFERKFKSVQKEIDYSNNIECMFFDIGFRESEEVCHITPYEKSIEYFENFNIPYVEILFKGSLDDCLKYTNIFPSTICENFGYKTYDKNICEGVVIKTLKNEYTFGDSRVIIKNKNKKFKEKIKKTKEEINFLESVKTCININRLNAVFSKDIYKKEDYGRFVMEYFNDVIEDLEVEIKQNKITPFMLGKMTKVIKGFIGYSSKKEYFERM